MKPNPRAAIRNVKLIRGVLYINRSGEPRPFAEDARIVFNYAPPCWHPYNTDALALRKYELSHKLKPTVAITDIILAFDVLNEYDKGELP